MKRTRLFADRLPSPHGDLFVVVDEDGALVRLDFVGSKERAVDEADLERSFAKKRIELSWDANRCEHVARELARYFAGELRSFELTLAPDGTPFQREVWEALARIPYGQTVTYGELAERIGRSKAARAVGRANGLNPISIVVPCHRVIGGNGTLTGYAGGLDRKRALLALEGSLESTAVGT